MCICVRIFIKFMFHRFSFAKLFQKPFPIRIHVNESRQRTVKLHTNPQLGPILFRCHIRVYRCFPCRKHHRKHRQNSKLAILLPQIARTRSVERFFFPATLSGMPLAKCHPPWLSAIFQKLEKFIRPLYSKWYKFRIVCCAVHTLQSVVARKNNHRNYVINADKCLWSNDIQWIWNKSIFLWMLTMIYSQYLPCLHLQELV